MWGGTDVKIPAGILFMAVKGVHASLPPSPFCGPAKARASNPELPQDHIRALYVDPDPHPGGYSYLRLQIFRLNPCMCDVILVAMHAGDQRAINGRSEPSPSGGRGGVTRAYKSHVVSHSCMYTVV